MEGNQPLAGDEDERIGQLIERLLVDGQFRAEFRADPRAACRALGLDELAAELDASGKTMYTLELRESKSSLAGVVMAVAAEGVGVAELGGLLGHHGLGHFGLKGGRPRGARLPRTPAAELRPLRTEGAPPPGSGGGVPASGTPPSAAGAAPSGGSATPSGPASPGGGTPPSAGGSSLSGPSGDAPSSPGQPSGGGGAPWPGQPSGGGAPLGEAVPGAGVGEPPATGAGSVAELLASPRLVLPTEARALLTQGAVDPRLVSVLSTAVSAHTVVVGGFESVADPVHAQAIDIVSVDGHSVSPGNLAARDLITEIAALDPSVRPNEIDTPWPIQSQGFFTDSTHQHRLRLAFVSPFDYQPGGGAVPVPGSAPAGGAGVGPVAATPAAAGVAQAADQAIAEAQSVSGGRVSMQAQSGALGGARGLADQWQPSGLSPHGASSPGGGYVNPFPADVRMGRTDMGVDADMKPGDAIVAPGRSRVLGMMPNWYSGQPYVALQLLDGPMKGRNYYLAEQIHVAVNPGEVIQQGQPIAHYAASGTGIEMGWAGDKWQQTKAQATTGYSEGEVTPAGSSFRKWLDSLPRHGSQTPSPIGGPGAAPGASPAASGAPASEVASAPATPARVTASFKAAEPHQRRVHRHTVQFLAAVRPEPDKPLSEQVSAGGQSQMTGQRAGMDMVPSGGSKGAWLQAIRQQETGGASGNYQQNSSGCMGAYCWANMGDWASMAQKAGYGRYANTPPYRLPAAIQDAVAWAMMGPYVSKGQYAQAAEVWNGGQPRPIPNPALGSSAVYAQQVIAKFKALIGRHR